jgi:hypothetical protein
MDLLILIAFGLGTTLPCVGLWLADVWPSSDSATSG